MERVKWKGNRLRERKGWDGERKWNGGIIEREREREREREKHTHTHTHTHTQSSE